MRHETTPKPAWSCQGRPVDAGFEINQAVQSTLAGDRADIVRIMRTSPGRKSGLPLLANRPSATGRSRSFNRSLAGLARGWVYRRSGSNSSEGESAENYHGIDPTDPAETQYGSEVLLWTTAEHQA